MTFLDLQGWVGSEIKVANHVSRPIAPSPPSPTRGILEFFGDFWTIIFWKWNLYITHTLHHFYFRKFLLLLYQGNFWQLRLLIHISNILTILRSYWYILVILTNWPFWGAIVTYWLFWGAIVTYWLFWGAIDTNWPFWGAIDTYWPFWGAIDTYWPFWGAIVTYWLFRGLIFWQLHWESSTLCQTEAKFQVLSEGSWMDFPDHFTFL